MLKSKRPTDEAFQAQEVATQPPADVLPDRKRWRGSLSVCLAGRTFSRELLTWVDELSVDLDVVFVRICFSAKLGYNLAVECYLPRSDEVFGMSAGGNARCGN